MRDWSGCARVCCRHSQRIGRLATLSTGHSTVMLPYLQMCGYTTFMAPTATILFAYVNSVGLVCSYCIVNVSLILAQNIAHAFTHSYGCTPFDLFAIHHIVHPTSDRDNKEDTTIALPGSDFNALERLTLHPKHLTIGIKSPFAVDDLICFSVVSSRRGVQPQAFGDLVGHSDEHSLLPSAS